ncbi:MAG: HEAT repeat domain-containing protein [Brevefilum sp.]|nr:HEAT repeat domain-containing protein [Brevefilum sp.]
MSRFDQDPFEFEAIKAALLDNTAPFPAAMTYYFSDIPAEDLDLLAAVWPEVWVERRRGLLEDMENLAEGDTLLFFDPMAIMCLRDEDPVARATAVRLLWQSQEEDLVPLFLGLLREDPEAIVRAAAATALGLFVYLGELEEIKTSTYQVVLESLIQAHLDSPDTLVRRRALEALGYAGHPEVSDFIRRAYDTNDEDWLQSALFAMGRSCDNHWSDSVMAMFDHPDNVVRYEAIRAAGELEIKAARELILDLLEEGTDDDDIYFAAIWSLSKIGGEGVRSLIEIALEETEDLEEIRFLEEALENLDFTEQINTFDMMFFEEDDPDNWFDEDEDDFD